MLPLVSGLDLLAHLERIGKIPVLAMSASPAQLSRAELAGADFAIAKPFGFEDLLAQIRTAVARRCL